MSREDTLDLSTLSELLILQEDGESDIIDEMMSFYLIEAVERLKDIRNAMDLNDDQWLMKTAHKLKGSSSQMGAARVASLCSRLRESETEEERENILSLLREEFDVFRGIISGKPRRKMSSTT